MKARELFTTIRTEGGLLPADLLQRIVHRDKELSGLDEASYHLITGERLNERISQSRNRLLGAWKAFRTAAETLPERDTGTTLTRERWLLILFQEFGYGRLPTAYSVRRQHCWLRVFLMKHFSPSKATTKPLLLYYVSAIESSARGKQHLSPLPNRQCHTAAWLTGLLDVHFVSPAPALWE